MSRAAQLDCQHLHSCALVLTLFLFQKGQGFFPPLPIAALLRRSWLWAYAPLAGWDVSMWLVYFCNTKGQRDFKSTLAFLASHEACRRMAVFAMQPAGSRTRPASLEACCRAAVVSRPSRMSPEQPRALWARSGVQGVTPCQTREPRGLLPSGGSFAAKSHVPRSAPRPKGAVGGQGVLPLVKRGGSLTTTTRLRQGKRRNWGKSRCGPPQACAVRGRKKPPRGRHKRLSLNADTAYQRNVEFV